MSHGPATGAKISAPAQTGGSVPARRIRLAAAAALGVLLLSACAEKAPQDTFEPEGAQADKIYDLVVPVFGVAGVVFVLVMAGALFIAFKFRRHDDDDSVPDQIHGNTKLEIGWTLVPAALLTFIAVFTVATILDLADQDDEAMTVEVFGQQWWWSYEYDLDGDGNNEIVTANDLVIPTGEEVNLKIQSRDVIHSFWAPKLNGKMDAVPGRVHNLTLQTDSAGVYLGQCTEYCGLSHGYMRLRVVALSPDDFAAWADNQRQPAVEPSSELAQEGRDVFESQCTTCHLIRGVNDDAFAGSAQVSGVAPDLTHFASRGVFAGGIFDLYQDADGDGFGDIESGAFQIAQLEAWLRNPPAEKPMAPEPNRGSDLGRGMPDRNLTEDQIDALVAYLTELE